VLHPNYAPELYLEGAATRQTMLSREHHGPRAILNALERLATSYGAPCVSVRQDLAIAEAQLRDYQSRLGAPFLHDAYLSQLTTLRDRLKVGLSGATPEPGSEPLPTVSEVAKLIKSLKAAHTVEATPQRVGKRRSTAEEPVTARIRRRAEASSAPAPAMGPDPLRRSDSDAKAAETPAETSLPPESPAIPGHHAGTGQDRPARPKFIYQESAARCR
jgi:hypothetical protein